MIFGDGAFGYSVAEFDTFVRHEIPVVALIGNDACWSQIPREQLPMFGSSVTCGLAYTKYHSVVEGFGASGCLLDSDTGKSDNDIDACLMDAVKKNRVEKKSIVINALIDKSTFREGSISV